MRLEERIQWLLQVLQGTQRDKLLSEKNSLMFNHLLVNMLSLLGLRYLEKPLV